MPSRTVPISKTLRRQKNGGFTLPEVVIAGGMLAMFIAAAVVAMTQINHWATASRLRTLALSLAQQKADEALTTPWQLRGTRPDVLKLGTTKETAMPLNNDNFNEAAGLSSLFTKLDTPISADRTTTVTDISTRLARIDIEVAFTYRTRPYKVNLSTLRTTDNF